MGCFYNFAIYGAACSYHFQIFSLISSVKLDNLSNKDDESPPCSEARDHLENQHCALKRERKRLRY